MRWVRDTSSLKNEIPRPVPLNKKCITAVVLHVFGDATIIESCAVVCALVHQPSVKNQGFVVNKFCIFKKNFAVPILELVSKHMAPILIENVKVALDVAIQNQ